MVHKQFKQNPILFQRARWESSHAF
jgi:hypothetical protein